MDSSLPELVNLLGEGGSFYRSEQLVTEW
jgi:hypothetical protein